jgi:hypothetical protein
MRLLRSLRPHGRSRGPPGLLSRLRPVQLQRML